jgi:hypothetical protein
MRSLSCSTADDAAADDDDGSKPRVLNSACECGAESQLIASVFNWMHWPSIGIQ